MAGLPKEIHLRKLQSYATTYFPEQFQSLPPVEDILSEPRRHTRGDHLETLRIRIGENCRNHKPVWVCLMVTGELAHGIDGLEDMSTLDFPNIDLCEPFRFVHSLGCRSDCRCGRGFKKELHVLLHYYFALKGLQVIIKAQYLLTIFENICQEIADKKTRLPCDELSEFFSGNFYNPDDPTGLKDAVWFEGMRKLEEKAEKKFSPLFPSPSPTRHNKNLREKIHNQMTDTEEQSTWPGHETDADDGINTVPYRSASPPFRISRAGSSSLTPCAKLNVIRSSTVKKATLASSTTLEPFRPPETPMSQCRTMVDLTLSRSTGNRKRSERTSGADTQRTKKRNVTDTRAENQNINNLFKELCSDIINSAKEQGRRVEEISEAQRKESERAVEAELYRTELEQQLEEAKNIQHENERGRQEAERRLKDTEAHLKETKARLQDTEARAEDAEARAEDAEARAEDAVVDLTATREHLDDYKKETGPLLSKAGQLYARDEKIAMVMGTSRDFEQKFGELKRLAEAEADVMTLD